MEGPLFLLQIVDAETGMVVRLPAGGVLEQDLVSALTAALMARSVRVDEEVIAACQAAIVARGVGLFRTEAHVRGDIEAGLRDVFGRVVAGTLPLTASATIAASVRDVLSLVKKPVRGVV